MAVFFGSLLTPSALKSNQDIAHLTGKFAFIRMHFEICLSEFLKNSPKIFKIISSLLTHADYVIKKNK